MSVDECSQLVRGETLTNTTDHSSTRGTASTAKGFSFGIGDSEQAKKDLRRLRGIIRAERLLVFEPKDISKFTPCQGRYVDYEKIDSEGKCVDDYPIAECLAGCSTSIALKVIRWTTLSALICFPNVQSVLVIPKKP